METEGKNYILVVDDDKRLRESIDEILQDHYDTKTASDGVEAYDVLKKNGVRLIITDMRMPGMDGEQLLEKAKKKWPKIPVIIVTAYRSQYPRSEMIKKGAFAYIEKPFHSEELLRSIKEALSNA